MAMYLNSNQTQEGSIPSGIMGPPWYPSKVISKGDYNYVLLWEHPNCTKNGYVLQHRVVMENKLGRLLDKKEIVHHINSNKKDNRPENLDVMLASTHGKLHKSGVTRKWVSLVCPQCGEIFEKEQNHTHLILPTSFTTCSRRCRGKFSARKQWGGITDEIRSAMAANVRFEYTKEFNPCAS